VEDNVEKGFGEWAAQYEETVGREVEMYSGMKYDEFRDRLMKAIDTREGDVALDIGTGTALVAIEVAKKTGEKVVAVDITPFADTSFDLITSALAMHHMEIPQVLPEMIRVLKKGGHLVIADLGASPSWRTPLGRIFVGIFIFLYRSINPFDAKRRAETAAFKNVYTPKEWEKLLGETSLSTFKVRSYPNPKKKLYPLIFIVTATK